MKRKCMLSVASGYMGVSGLLMAKVQHSRRGINAYKSLYSCLPLLGKHKVTYPAQESCQLMLLTYIL